MQFILTSSEFNALVPKSKLKDMTKKALKASILIAETIPRNEHGWKGCIVNRTSEYCDQCPALKYCPYGYKIWHR